MVVALAPHSNKIVFVVRMSQRNSSIPSDLIYRRKHLPPAASSNEHLATDASTFVVDKRNKKNPWEAVNQRSIAKELSNIQHDLDIHSLAMDADEAELYNLGYLPWKSSMERVEELVQFAERQTADVLLDYKSTGLGEPADYLTKADLIALCERAAHLSNYTHYKPGTMALASIMQTPLLALLGGVCENTISFAVLQLVQMSDTMTSSDVQPEIANDTMRGLSFVDDPECPVEDLVQLNFQLDTWEYAVITQTKLLGVFHVLFNSYHVEYTLPMLMENYNLDTGQLKEDNETIDYILGDLKRLLSGAQEVVQAFFEQKSKQTDVST